MRTGHPVNRRRRDGVVGARAKIAILYSWADLDGNRRLVGQHLGQVCPRAICWPRRGLRLPPARKIRASASPGDTSPNDASPLFTPVGDTPHVPTAWDLLFTPVLGSDPPSGPGGQRILERVNVPSAWSLLFTPVPVAGPVPEVADQETLDKHPKRGQTRSQQKSQSPHVSEYVTEESSETHNSLIRLDELTQAEEEADKLRTQGVMLVQRVLNSLAGRQAKNADEGKKIVEGVRLLARRFGVPLLHRGQPIYLKWHGASFRLTKPDSSREQIDSNDHFFSLTVQTGQHAEPDPSRPTDHAERVQQNKSKPGHSLS